MASERLLRVFLDANVIFSGIYSEAGTNAAILRYAAAGVFNAVISVEIIDELARNIVRKAPHLTSLLATFLDEANLEVVSGPPEEEAPPWFDAGLAEDAHVVAAAREADIDYICTGDRRLRERCRSARTGVETITPRELLTLLGLST